MGTKTLIHTTITPYNKKILLEHGKGSLSLGIENLIKIAESKSITVTIISEIVV